MPVDYKPEPGNRTILYQRKQYRKSLLTRFYWDYRDKMIFSFIKERKIIVDLGCGEGITLQRLTKQFPLSIVAGIDLSFENLEICRKHELLALQNDSENLCFQDNSVDCCLLIEVIEHLPHPEKTLQEIFRILKKDGILIALFPNDRIFRITRLATGKITEAFYDYGHLKQWSPAAVNRLLQSSDFSVLHNLSIPFRLWSVSLHHLVVARKE